MRNTLQSTLLALLGVSAIFMASCSDKDPIIADEPVVPSTGMYVLNEGLFRTAGTSSLSYIDFETKEVTPNIFQANNTTAELGADPADMGQYGSLLFVSATSSDKVLVIDAASAKQIKVIDIEQPRYLAFHSGKVFVGSYTNQVFVVDTLTNSVTAKIPVGSTPEQITSANGKIYVANSGSNDYIAGGNHDNRVFVIDPVALTVDKEIEVADNVYHLHSDGAGHVYAGTVDIFNSDWSAILHPAKLYRINAVTDVVDKEFDFGVQHMASSDSKIYAISINYNGEDGKYNLLEMDSDGNNIRKLDYFSSISFDSMYALAVDRESGDIWVSNAEQSNAGTVYHYSIETQETEEFMVGLYPSSLVFKK